LIEFLVENDDLAKKVARNGRDWIAKNLKPQDIQCYWNDLLADYSNRLDFKPKKSKEMIEITN